MRLRRNAVCEDGRMINHIVYIRITSGLIRLLLVKTINRRPDLALGISP